VRRLGCRCAQSENRHAGDRPPTAGPSRHLPPPLETVARRCGRWSDSRQTFWVQPTHRDAGSEDRIVDSGQVEHVAAPIVVHVAPRAVVGRGEWIEVADIRSDQVSDVHGPVAVHVATAAGAPDRRRPQHDLLTRVRHARAVVVAVRGPVAAGRVAHGRSGIRAIVRDAIAVVACGTQTVAAGGGSAVRHRGNGGLMQQEAGGLLRSGLPRSAFATARSAKSMDGPCSSRSSGPHGTWPGMVHCGSDGATH